MFAKWNQVLFLWEVEESEAVRHLAYNVHELQGEDPDYAWVVTVLTFYLHLVCGVIGAVLSASWLIQART